eukprot:3523684-Prymnesium_polylepis.1
MAAPPRARCTQPPSPKGPYPDPRTGWRALSELTSMRLHPIPEMQNHLRAPSRNAPPLRLGSIQPD